ncbi:MAG: hypothetical protein K2P51_07960 [Rhabdochlamydiaceae bacterium]|nr:hypothetical protein [Rhabdochlamydiaceae bacterium]
MFLHIQLSPSAIRWIAVCDRLASGVGGVIGTLSSVAVKASQIAKGVFTGVLPHAVDYFFWSTTRAALPTRFFLPLIAGNYLLHQGDAKLTKLVLFSGMVVKFMPPEFIPYQATAQVALEVVALIAESFGGVRALLYAKRQLSRARAAETDTAARVSSYVSGALVMTMGVVSLGSAAKRSIHLFQGCQRFGTLDTTEQDFVLRNQAIPLLAGEKSCRAVIISGDESNLPDDPFTSPTYHQLIYENCETRGYKINSSEQLCEVLSQSTLLPTEASIDLLSLFGHSTARETYLGPTYRFTGNAMEMECLRKYLSQEAQVVLSGCNTADARSYQSGVKKTLTSQLSKGLPDRLITGFTSQFFVLWTRAVYSERRLHIQSYNFFEGSFNCVSYLNGQEIQEH